MAGAGPVTVLSTSDLHKVSSPELASLAAKYVSMSDDAAFNYLDAGEGTLSPGGVSDLMADVRRLAASVLSQADEGKPAHGGTMWRDRPIEETTAAERAGLE